VPTQPWHSRCDWARPWRGKFAALAVRDAAAPHHRIAQGGAHPGGFKMSQLVAIVKSLRNEEGQDLLEYALLVALIALIAIGAVGAAGGAVNNIFTAIANALSAAA
jgi:pilus assembly protein Flp/PilA